MDSSQALFSTHHSRVASDARKRLHAVVSHAGELRYSGIHIGRTNRKGQVTLADEVRHTFAHLVVQDAVVFIHISARALLVALEEDLVANLVCRYRRIHDVELHGGFRTEVIE